jgi:hypothetical protein
LTGVMKKSPRIGPAPANRNGRDTLFHSVLTRERDGKHGKIHEFGRP